MDEIEKDEPKNKHAAALSALGAAKGGRTRAEKLSPEQRSAIARAAAQKRWAMETSDVPKATHEGPLHIKGLEIDLQCAVLEDSTRLISRATLVKAIGRKGKVKGGEKYQDESKMPVFLAAENLNAFVPEDLRANYAPVFFKPLKGLVSIGYRAEILPMVCNVFLDAKEAGALQPNQMHIAERCRILQRGLSIVGITALVDEATGFEKVRDRLALQAILDKFLRKELAAWAKRFPDEFYQQIFRLRGWEWKGMTVNRPQIVANYTKDLVYKRLATGVLEKLEQVNPIDDRGYRPAKHHQWLTEDVGNPALAQHLHAVIAIMRASKSWEEFKSILDRAFPAKGANMKLF